MTFPVPVTLTIEVQSLTPVEGGTLVKASVLDAPLADFVLKRDLKDGEDAMKPEIVSEAIDQIARALEVAQ